MTDVPQPIVEQRKQDAGHVEDVRSPRLLMAEVAGI